MLVLNADTGVSMVQDGSIHEADINADVARLGVGQTWQDMTASRVPGTTYTNNTSKPIMANVTTTSTTAGATGVATISGLTMYFGTYPAGYYINVAVVIPAGATYSISNNGASTVLFKWHELR